MSKAGRHIHLCGETDSNFQRECYQKYYRSPYGGTLLLTHIEDDAVFSRYIEAIGKIPAIPTEEAEKLLRARLLKDPSDYIDTCTSALADHDLAIRVERIVTMGHHLKEYERLIADALVGDERLFARQDGVEEAWRIVEPMLNPTNPVVRYAAGSWGPLEADDVAPRNLGLLER